MGGSSSKSDSDQQAAYQDTVWEGQAPYLQSMYDQAGSLFGNTLGSMNNLIPGATNDIGNITNQANDYWQNQASGGVYQDMGLQNSLMNSLNQSMNNPSAESEINAMIMGGDGNNYADAMKEQYTNDANEAAQNMMANMDARATASGMSGGSRHGTAMAQGYDDINRNLQNNLAATGFNTFDQDLDRKLGIAQRADTNTLAQQQMMQQMLGSQQSTQDTGYNNAAAQQGLSLGTFAPSMMTWDAMGAYSNALGGPTILGSGTESGSSNSKGSSGGVAGGK